MKEDKEGREKLKEKLKAEMQVSEARVLAQVEFVREAVENFCSFTLIFPLDPSNIDPEPTSVVPDPTSATLATNEEIGLP